MGVNELYNTFGFLQKISELKNAGEIEFSNICSEYHMEPTSIYIARNQFFDKNGLKIGGYTWNSIKPNVKMAQRLIEESNKLNKAKMGKIEKTYKKWDSQQVELLKKYINDGLPNKDIANKMNRSVTAIEVKKCEIKKQLPKSVVKKEVPVKTTTIEATAIQPKPTIQPEVKPIVKVENFIDKEDLTWTINFTEVWGYTKNFLIGFGLSAASIGIWESVKYIISK